MARETADRANDICESVKSFDDFLEEVLKQAAATLDRTPHMLKVLAQAGVVDAGGKGFLYLLLGFLKALRGEEIILNDRNRPISVGGAVVEDIVEGEHLEFPYCTEFIIKNPKGDAEQLK